VEAGVVLRIGLISDTHGLLRPEALDHLKTCDRIIHAGDVCDPAVLRELALLAPITAVRGNNDVGSWADRLRDFEMIQAEGVQIGVIHDLAHLGAPPAGMRVVVSGHSHRPGIMESDGVIYVNPGSAGPRRFKLPVTFGELLVDGETARVRLHALQGSLAGFGLLEGSLC
jgi:putative phosphoesterase